jgi:hypothetical protein
VNTDEDERTLRKSIEIDEITWRCWHDGGTDGPITSRWSIDGFPTVYVLDAQGIIRHKNAKDGELEEAAETLLRELREAVRPPLGKEKTRTPSADST